MRDRIIKTGAPYGIPPFVFTAIYLIYFYFNRVPVGGGGLYLAMARAVQNNGYHLPLRIPYYTQGGIPFGYPPLAFYVGGFLLQLGISPIALARVAPLFLLTAASAIYVVVAFRFLGSKWRACFASLIVVTSPRALTLTLSAGGFVRASALVFSLLTIFGGYNLFIAKQRRSLWTIVTGVCFALTLSTHLIYALFAAMSLVVISLWFDRTIEGFSRGGLVAGVGFLLSAPWWVTVIRRYGIALFLTASRTHGGVTHLTWLQAVLSPVTNPISLWPALIAVSGVYLVIKRDWFFTTWFLLAGFLIGKSVFLVLIGALMVTQLVFDGVIPTLQKARPESRVPNTRTIQITLFVGLLLVYSFACTGLFVSGESQQSTSFTQFINSDSLQAMHWTRNQTPTESTFVVVGDASEWFPLIAHRTSLVAARGSEWTGQRQQMMKLRSRVSGCLSATCMTGVLRTNHLNPDYILILKKGYIAGDHKSFRTARWRYLLPSLRSSTNYTQVYHNSGAVVFKYTSHDNKSQAKEKPNVKAPTESRVFRPRITTAIWWE